MNFFSPAPLLWQYDTGATEKPSTLEKRNGNGSSIGPRVKRLGLGLDTYRLCDFQQIVHSLRSHALSSRTRTITTAFPTFQGYLEYPTSQWY